MEETVEMRIAGDREKRSLKEKILYRYPALSYLPKEQKTSGKMLCRVPRGILLVSPSVHLTSDNPSDCNLA